MLAAAPDSHPDYAVVRLEEDAKQIKIEQVRELIEALTLKSYRGGYKVGVIEGAEALNTNSANAFLKTLEEPSADTMLMLIARPTPSAAGDHCQPVPAPGSQAPPQRSEALAWLTAHGRPDQDWPAALALAGGAPLAALEMQEAGARSRWKRRCRRMLSALAAGAVDVTLLADHWVRSNLPLRITWLENWITRRVHACLGAANSNQSAERVRLPAALLKPKMRALFELLDAVRDLRRLGVDGHQSTTGAGGPAARRSNRAGEDRVILGTIGIAKSE